MKNLFLLLVLSASFSVKAQYYYNDILGTKETNRMMRAYISNKVLSVSSIGYDADGVRTTDYSEQQNVLQNGKALRIATKTATDVSVVFYHFDEQARVINVSDSESFVKNETSYSYDANGRILSIKNIVKDTSNEFDQVEIHQWIYDASGKLQKMYRIINDKDSTEFKFHLDDNGNVIDEQSFKKGIAGELINYYYDDKNRLTDVVRYNEKYKKLLPDFMLEYDDQENVLQKTTLLSNLNLGYLIWRYVFNDKGLKTKEALFNKEKQMTGKIEYTYTFN